MIYCFFCSIPWHPATGYVTGPQNTPICAQCAKVRAQWVQQFTWGKRNGFYEHV